MVIRLVLLPLIVYGVPVVKLIVPAVTGLSTVTVVGVLLVKLAVAPATFGTLVGDQLPGVVHLPSRLTAHVELTGPVVISRIVTLPPAPMVSML